MTGKETKVLQGYGSLAHQHVKPDEDDIKRAGMYLKRFAIEKFGLICEI